jgi:hypothetical protein
MKRLLTSPAALATLVDIHSGRDARGRAPLIRVSKNAGADKQVDVAAARFGSSCSDSRRFPGRVVLEVSPLVAFGALGYRTKQSADA